MTGRGGASAGPDLAGLWGRPAFLVDVTNDYYLMVPKSTKKPAANKSSRLSPKIRTSKADAKQALIKATIKILDTQPITEITVQDISEEAGVNYTYINRYFKTNLNLFAEVTDALADIVKDKSFDAINKYIRKQKASPTNVSVAELDQTRLVTLPIAMKRLWLVQYLVASGVPADRFVAKSKESFALSYGGAKPK